MNCGIKDSETLVLIWLTWSYSVQYSFNNTICGMTNKHLKFRLLSYTNHNKEEILYNSYCGQKKNKFYIKGRNDAVQQYATTWSEDYVKCELISSFAI